MSNEKIEKKANSTTNIPNIAFNVLGIAPTACKYQILTSELENFTYRLAKEFFGSGSDGVHSVAIDSDINSSDVSLFVWFKWDSAHIVDKTLLGDNNAILNRVVPKLSPELKRFMSLYCREENQRLYGEGDGRGGEQSYKCIKVDIFKILCEIFDTRGKSYKDKFNQDREIRSKIIVNAVWDKKTEKVFKFDIEKRDDRGNTRTPIRPVSAFRG